MKMLLAAALDALFGAAVSWARAQKEARAQREVGASRAVDKGREKLGEIAHEQSKRRTRKPGDDELLDRLHKHDT